MNENKPTLLIVEDDLDIADMLNAYFRVQGYEVLTVNWGEDGIRACQTNLPDLVILDIRLPDIDGFEVAGRLRANRRTQHVPIIFLTEKRERMARLKGLELNADDYITKPFDIQELRLRVRNALQRAQRGSLTHPVTGISEGDLVQEKLNSCLTTRDWSMLVVGLKNLDYFREVYGFVASDDLLRAVALMLKEITAEFDSHAFLGHLTTTDFLIVTRPSNISDLKNRIQRRLDQSFTYFYRDQDREANRFSQQPLGVLVNEVSPAQDLPDEVYAFRESLERISRQGA